jgi:FixJ family two-component response regulator
LNAVDYLTKPVSEARLRDAIRAQDRLERSDLLERAATEVRDDLRPPRDRAEARSDSRAAQG